MMGDGVLISYVSLKSHPSLPHQSFNPPQHQHPQNNNRRTTQDDPYWDDDEEEWPDYSDLDLDDEAKQHERLYEVPADDETIMVGMKDWVDAIIADLGVCPFTVSAAKAGE